MRKPIIFLLFLLTIHVSTLVAQKNKKDIPVNVTEVERSTSLSFAEALRDYYALDLASAEKKLRTIIAKNSRHHPSYYMLSKIMVQRKNYADAIDYLNMALKNDKNNDWYKEELAKIYDVIGSYDKSAMLWKELSKSKSSNELYLFSLADAYLHLEKFTEVIKVYDKVEVLIGYNEEITEVKKNIWLYLNNVKNAVGEYDRLIAEFPQAVKYYVKAGNIFLTNELPNKAWNYYQKAVKIDPNNAELQFALFDYHRKVGNHKESYESLIQVFQSQEFPADEKITILKSLFSNYLRNNSTTKISKNQLYEITTIVTEIHPYVADGWAQLSALQLLDKNYEDARFSLEKVLDIDVSRYNIWEDYLFVLSQLKDYQTITSLENEVITLFPSNALLLYSFGVAHLNEGDPEKSLELLQQAQTFAFEPPLIAQIYNMTGNAYFELSRIEEAVKYWKLAKKKGLNSNDLNEKLSKYE